MFSEFKINRIAVPTDFSESANLAVDHAVDVAKRFRADLVLIHVLESGAYQGIFSPSKKTEYEEKEHAQQHLQDYAHALEKKSGLSVSQYVVSGRIHEQIVTVCGDVEADLIVMGTHGVSGWEEFFVGSNAFKVVTQSPCPVLTIQQKASAKNLKNIILPIDSSPESRQKVQHAASFAKKFGATVHIACLLTEDEPNIRFEFDTKVKQITDYFDREEIAHSCTTLVGSNLATMTMNFSESKGGNMIVMMTEQESNLTGFLMGPYAQQIVNHSRIPVLSVSPEEGEGFHLT
ncbi:MAG: universal stress protein [Flavobacteriales bacterium]|jgi:nucleotide-binding universal stress UspA family protein|nr:universal stress protein [Flavobacteriales bacterium]